MVERRTPDAIQADNERRIASVVRLGVVEEADYDARRLRVRMGDLLTGWIAWATPRANQDRTWHPVEVGEQVILAAPNGDLAQAVVIGAVNSNHNPGPEHPPGHHPRRPSVDRVEYEDGTVWEYDRRDHHWLLDMTANRGSMTIKTGSTRVEIGPDSFIVYTDYADFREG